jgi:membrane-associated protease RseP (regulator of RpoE activity)
VGDTFLALIAAVALATAIHLAGTVIAAMLMGVAIRTVSVGVGLSLASFTAGGVLFRLKILPFAGSVAFVTAKDELRGGRAFDDLGRAQKIAIALSGCFLCVVVAAVALGPQSAVHESAASWRELFGELTALPALSAQWVRVIEAARSSDFVPLAGLACAKVGGLNLLPLAPLSGGAALRLLLGGKLDELSGPLANLYLKLSLLVLALVVLAWVIGGAALLLRSIV